MTEHRSDWNAQASSQWSSICEALSGGHLGPNGFWCAVAVISTDSFAHVRLTVTDIARSKKFYDRVFGWPVVIDMSDQIDEPGVRESSELFFGGVVYRLPTGTMLGLRPVATRGQRFDADHVGLDDISFVVATRRELTEAAAALDRDGVARGEVTDHDGGAFLPFFDPDGISLELTTR